MDSRYESAAAAAVRLGRVSIAVANNALLLLRAEPLNKSRLLRRPIVPLTTHDDQWPTRMEQQRHSAAITLSGQVDEASKAPRLLLHAKVLAASIRRVRVMREHSADELCGELRVPLA